MTSTDRILGIWVPHHQCTAHGKLSSKTGRSFALMVRKLTFEQVHNSCGRPGGLVLELASHLGGSIYAGLVDGSGVLCQALSGWAPRARDSRGGPCRPPGRPSTTPARRLTPDIAASRGSGWKT